MSAINHIRTGLDRFLETLVALIMAVLVADVVWQVFTRFVLNSPSSWTDELATFLLIWAGLLGACVALKRGAHLGIDYFVGKLKPRSRVYTDLLVFICTGLFAGLVLGYGGLTLVIKTLSLDQISPALGIKMGYVYLALPISGFFLLIYSLEFLGERITTLYGNSSEHAAPPESGPSAEA